jgi:hypothetical protein
MQSVKQLLKLQQNLKFIKPYASLALHSASTHLTVLAMASLIRGRSDSPMQATILLTAGTVPGVLIAPFFGKRLDSVSPLKLQRILAPFLIANMVLICFLNKSNMILVTLLIFHSLIATIIRSSFFKTMGTTSGQNAYHTRFVLFSVLIGTLISGLLLKLSDNVALVAGLTVLLNLPWCLMLAFASREYKVEHFSQSTSEISALKSIHPFFNFSQVKRSALWVILFQGFFQGAYGTLITQLPKFHEFVPLSSGVSLFQAAVSVGLIIGASFFLKTSLPLSPKTTFLFIVMCCMFIALSFAPFPLLSVLSFGCMHILFEFAWMKNISKALDLTPVTHRVRINLNINACASFVMVSVSMLLAMGIQLGALAQTLLIWASCAIFFGMIAWWIEKKSAIQGEESQ